MRGRRKVGGLLLVLGVLLSLFVPVLAQPAPAALAIKIDDVDVEGLPRVVCRVTVRDVNGVPVPGLEASDFEINEDRAPQAQPIQALKSVVNPEQPLDLVVLLDISSSMAGAPLANAKAAIEALLAKMGEGDRIALLAFSDTISLDEVNSQREISFTNDRELVQELVQGLSARGGTPLYDALYKGALWAEGATLGHRAIILLTDGVDEGPGSLIASSETPIQQAQRVNVPVFAIGLGNRIDRGYLERVSRTTGGIHQETPDSEELTALFLNVHDWLKQQYVITYTSDLPPDGAVHRVQINVDVRGRVASTEVAMGPLPFTPTPAPTPTATPSPTPTPILVVPTTPTPEPTPTGFIPQAGAWVTRTASSFWTWLLRWILWILLGLLLLAMVVVAFMTLFRSGQQKAAAQEFCAVCSRPLNLDEICLACGPNAGRVRYVEPPASQQAV